MERETGHELLLPLPGKPRGPRAHAHHGDHGEAERPGAADNLPRSHSEGNRAFLSYPHPRQGSLGLVLGSYHRLVPAGSGTVWPRPRCPPHWSR